jgi:ribonuclease HI
MAAIFTHRRITIHSLKNNNNHNYLIEENRNKVSNLETANRTIEFSWFKACAGTYGNELSDQLAKEAARNFTLRFPTTGSLSGH